MHTACNHRSHLHPRMQAVVYYCVVAVLIHRAETGNLGKHAIANWTTRWNIAAAML